MGFLRFLGPCFSVSIMRQAFGHTCICITTWACAGFCIASRLQFAPLKHLSKTNSLGMPDVVVQNRIRLVFYNDSDYASNSFVTCSVTSFAKS